MWIVKLLFLFLVWHSTDADNREDNNIRDNVPVFSSTYILKGQLLIPYAEITEPFAAWYDETAGSSRIDYYGGMVKTYQLAKAEDYGTSLKVAPITTEKETNVESCFQNNGTEEFRVNVQSVLPDLEGFEMIGKDTFMGVEVDVWRNVTDINGKINNYTMYLVWKKEADGSNAKQAVPIFYEMKGYNSLLGSHYDHYYILYSEYSFEKPDPSVFRVPPNMKCGNFPGPGAVDHHATFNPMHQFIHNDRRHLDNEWEKFHRIHKKRDEYKTQKEHEMRRHIFDQNVRYIDSKNRAGLGYTLAVNHLTDRNSDELKALLGYRRSANRTAGEPFPYTLAELNSNINDLPESWDWRLYGAVTPVKDQSVCGSCWSFGTTGTVEGAYFLATGQQARFSQQALVDCSWGFGNNGCDGGEDFRAYGWIKKHGLPTEAEYGPYLGQDGYCHAKPGTAKISGFVDVTPDNEVALKTALIKHGPISIAIDAELKSFSYFANGVYYDPDCGSSESSLDHAVLLVGYGSLAGKPYWLVKNSWSNYWGNDGYILISTKDNICGVMTAPTYVNILK